LGEMKGVGGSFSMFFLIAEAIKGARERSSKLVKRGVSGVFGRKWGLP